MTDQNMAVKMMMNVLIDVVIVTFIFIAILAYIQNIYNDDTIEKNYIARDLALSIESIQVPQGNTQLTYAKDTNSYTIFLKEGKAQVFDTRDQPEPPTFLRGISSYSIDSDVEFEDMELNYAGAELHPLLVKTDNRILISPINEKSSVKLYGYEDVYTKQQSKYYKFYSTDLEQYTKAQVQNINSLLGTQFIYSPANPDFVISKSIGENMIYCPASKEKRKLASLIANRFIEDGTDFLIMPPGNNVFTIKIQEKLTSKLSTVLEKSFWEYYNG